MKRILFAAALLLSLLVVNAGNNRKLLYTGELVPSAKQKMEKDSLMQKAWNEIKSVADAQLKRNSVDKLDYLSLVYIMTGDKA